MSKEIVYMYNDVYKEPQRSLAFDTRNMSLYFSSTTHLKRFKKKLEETKERFDYWTKVFNLDYINLEVPQLIYTYELVEKRGFLIDVYVNDKVVEYKCQEEIKKALSLVFFKELD